MKSTNHSPGAPRSDSQMLPTDAFFWYAAEATPQLRPLVAGLFMLDRAPDRERFRAALAQLLAHMPRLQQRVVTAPLSLRLPRWVEDPHFDLDYHLREVILPQPGSQRHLLDFAGAMFAAPLDPMRPLWEGYLIEGLAGGRAAYLLKMHHSIMDGAGAVALFEVLTQADRDTPVHVPRWRATRRRGAAAPKPSGMAREVFRGAVAGLGGAINAAARAVSDPTGAFDNLARTLWGMQSVVRDFTAAATLDPLGAACTGVGRRLDAVSLSLPRMRRLKERLDVTLNDLVLTVVAGALGRYHAHRGVHLEQLQCMVPMSLRREGEQGLPGNRVGVFRVALPVGERDPIARLEAIHGQTAAAKGERHNSSYPLLMQAVSLVPAAAFRMLAQSVSGRVGLICSNVSGPPVARYIAGGKVEEVYPFAPVLLGIPLSVALVSYGDTYNIGIVADPAAIPDPELFGQYLREAVDELERHPLNRRPLRAAALLPHSRRRRPHRRPGIASVPRAALQR